MKAVWNGTVIAQSHDTVSRHFRPSPSSTICGWKGEASYFDVVVDGRVNQDAAWFYAEPKRAAREIAGRVAFWKGVEVTED